MATTTNFILNGEEINPPREAIPKIGEEGIVIESSFGVEDVQPSVTPLQFTFTNEGAAKLRQIVEDGDIFHNANLLMNIVGKAGTINAIDGYLDLASKYNEISPVQVVSEVKFRESTLSLQEQIQSVTLDLMDDLGVLTDSDYVDVPVVVEKPINFVEIVVTSITLYLMIKELAEAIEKISSDVSTVLGLTSTAATGSVGAVVYQIAIIAVRTAYAAVLLKSIIDLMTQLLENFISPVRNYKAITYKTALEKTFGYLGYNFVSPITELENFTYLPSNPSDGEPTQKGIPRVEDYGYNFSEFVALAVNQFNARLAVLDGDLHFRTESDPFWEKNSTFIMPDVLLEDLYSKQYNTEDLVKSRLIQYKIDSLDDWTTWNFKGTSYAVITQHTSSQDLKVSGLKGFERDAFPVSLGNRKDGLNLLEDILLTLAKAADVVTGVFGQNQDFSSRIENRVGMLKISRQNYSVPKVLYMVGGTIPENHRDLLSAKQAWNDYISYTSFVQNDFKRQREVYEGVQIGFGLDNYLETIKNSYFKTNSGRIGKFVNIRWAVELDSAVVDFWIEKNYTKKLKETFIEEE